MRCRAEVLTDREGGFVFSLGTKFKLIADHKPPTLIFNTANSKSTPRIREMELEIRAIKQ